MSRREEVNKKVSQKMRGRKNLSSRTGRWFTCEKCDSDFRKDDGFKRGRKIHCNKCKRKVKRRIRNPKSITELSGRTIAKMFTRAGISCSICGWDKSRLDIHHIVYKKDGGGDEHSNLITLCPNCHREAHADLIQREKLFENNIETKFKNWKDFYDVK